MHASFVAASACTCPDGLVETTTFASWKTHARAINACIDSDAACEQLCREVLAADMIEPVGIPRCVITETAMVGVTLDIQYLEPVDCGIGRKPAGLVSPPRCAGVGAWLSAVATLEAASVTAFARLVRTLVEHAAPRTLIDAARRAVGDELLHASLVGRLARRFGGTVTAPTLEPRPAPTIDELALENATEGQVGETFGALVAACQARGASDPEARNVFARIAIDEARHAALAHQLAPWFERRLGLPQRNVVARARQQAIGRIVAACDYGLSESERDVIGMPAPHQLRAAARQLFASVH